MQLPRFYPILDTSKSTDITGIAHALLGGGAEILQIRHKGIWDEPLLEQAHRIREMAPILIINDRADIAKILDAGLHVGQDDLPPKEVRKLLPDAVLGYSTHNENQLSAGNQEPVNYLALGPIFRTASKINPDPVVGLDTLRKIRSLTSLPLVAIGGIDRTNARDVLDAGADTVAVIGDVYPTNFTLKSLEERVKEWIRILN